MNSLIYEEQNRLDSSSSKRKRPSYAWIILIVTSLSSMTMGLSVTGSYLIKLTQLSCPTSKWNPSTAVYAESIQVIVGGMIGTARSSALNKLGHRTLYMLVILLLAATWSFCAVAVRYCDHGNGTDILYMLSYGVMPAMVIQLVNISVVVLLISWFPSHMGFCSSFPFACYAIGSLLFGQWFLYLERLYEESFLAAETVLLLSGILFVLFNVPAVFSVKLNPHQSDQCSDEEKTVDPRRWTFRDLLKDSRFWLLSWTRFSFVFGAWGLTGRQRSFLETIWRSPDPPIDALSAVAFGSFIAGSFLWMIISDKVKIEYLWMFGGVMQGLTMALLPVFISNNSSQWGVYAALVAFSLNIITFSIPLSLCVSLTGDTYSSRDGAHISGFLGPAFGSAGLLGPISADLVFRKTGSFNNFLFIGAAIAMSGLIALKMAYRVSRRRQKEEQS